MVISDTHGRMPKEVLEACRGADHIVHAGDVGREDFLDELGAIAPVAAVSGNVDPLDLAPLRARVKLGSWRILVQHIVWERGGPSFEIFGLLSEDPADLVIFGHSHEPLCERICGTVFLNPGSCGPKRFSLPKAFGEALLGEEGAWFRIFDLERGIKAPPILERHYELDRIK